MNRTLSGLAAVALLFWVVALESSWQTATAGVVQEVETIFVSGNGGAPVISTAEEFELSSNDIDMDIVATVGQAPPGGPGYVATASAGRFGQVGLDLATFGIPSGSSLSSRVLVASDEHVNIHSVPALVRTNFIIDGGQLRDFFSTNSVIRFTLNVGAENKGSESAIADAFLLGLEGSIAADFGAAGLLPGGGYTVTLSTDTSGNRTFFASGTGGLDLEATYHAGQGLIEIPLSLHSLELGTMNPGDRLLIGYEVEIEIEQDGVGEGFLAQFSDPFNLTGSPNPLFSANVTIVPVPEPAAALGAMSAVLVCRAGGRRFRWRRGSLTRRPG